VFEVMLFCPTNEDVLWFHSALPTRAICSYYS
jgi:hypothetical protein